jgi:hypothetical protein
MFGTRSKKGTNMITTCPNCQSKQGVTYITCSECGWNKIKHEFDWIRIPVSYVPVEEREYLIDRHHRLTAREPKDGSYKLDRRSSV